jgi:hypothetical protein
MGSAGPVFSMTTQSQRYLSGHVAAGYARTLLTSCVFTAAHGRHRDHRCFVRIHAHLNFDSARSGFHVWEGQGWAARARRRGRRIPSGGADHSTRRCGRSLRDRATTHNTSKSGVFLLPSEGCCSRYSRPPRNRICAGHHTAVRRAYRLLLLCCQGPFLVL